MQLIEHINDGHDRSICAGIRIPKPAPPPLCYWCEHHGTGEWQVRGRKQHRAQPSKYCHPTRTENVVRPCMSCKFVRMAQMRKAATQRAQESAAARELKRKRWPEDWGKVPSVS